MQRWARARGCPAQKGRPPLLAQLLLLVALLEVQRQQQLLLLLLTPVQLQSLGCSVHQLNCCLLSLRHPRLAQSLPAQGRHEAAHGSRAAPSLKGGGGCLQLCQCSLVLGACVWQVADAILDVPESLLVPGSDAARHVRNTLCGTWADPVESEGIVSGKLPAQHRPQAVHIQLCLLAGAEHLQGTQPGRAADRWAASSMQPCAPLGICWLL